MAVSLPIHEVKHRLLLTKQPERLGLRKLRNPPGVAILAVAVRVLVLRGKAGWVNKAVLEVPAVALRTLVAAVATEVAAAAVVAGAGVAASVPDHRS